ncbi:MAG: ATP phosphoribosyltransferase regulatory subunit [Coriobacteriia bacterium]|nr:ATP phosphoribosyltransferase regulatory subunit [Coriobacteriia bacterium]
MRPITPRGFRDVLPEEAAEREAVSAAIAAVFSSWGYDPVETPVVEVYETLSAAAGDLQGTAFRLFDLDGRLLALRPDVTVPVARLYAARMAHDAGIRRFRYRAEVFREHESLRGQNRQFTQLGVELVGAGGPAADAEVVAVLVEALAASGLADFTVAVGDVAVLIALLDAAGPGAGEAWRADVLAAAHDRNFVALDALAARVGGDVGTALAEVVRLRGGVEAIERCRAIVEPVVGTREVDDFARTWQLLEAAGVTDHVMVDFGVIRSFDYYTGLVLEAYAPGLGVALGGGGRYDTLLAAYDAPAPAAGFAIGLERLSIALADQGVVVPVQPSAAVVGGDAAAAFTEAARRRAAGERVALGAEVFAGEEVAS